MQLEISTKDNGRRSPVLAALGAGVAILMGVAFVITGAVHHLVGAFAFAVMAPTWYLLPNSLFTRSIGAHLKQPLYFPKWAQLLTGLGLALLFISLGLRWAA